MQNPFWHYHSTFDAEAVVRAHTVETPTPRDGLFVNFLDVAVDPIIYPPALSGRGGTVEAPPLPQNWHADLAEWGAALRAVDLSGDRFTMIELGCGWGCWMNNMGAAARRSGRAVKLIGVEGDPGHVQFAKDALARNGFDDAEWTLINGIGAGVEGTALFPRQEQAGDSWGLEPVFGATQEQLAAAEASGAFQILPMISLRDITGPHERIDLLHIDIQGGEADLVAACLDVMSEKVAFVVIGTHSREIEGRLFDIFLRAGWALDMERPAILTLAHGDPMVTVDGLQGWRNPRLLPLQV